MHNLRVLIASFGFLAPVFGAPLFLVVPNAQTNSPGNMLDHVSGGASPDGRQQEVFGRGQFLGVGGPLLINQFAFRAAPGAGPVSLEATSLMVHLSTSSFAPNTNPGNTLVTYSQATGIRPLPTATIMSSCRLMAGPSFTCR